MHHLHTKSLFSENKIKCALLLQIQNLNIITYQYNKLHHHLHTKSECSRNKIKCLFYSSNSKPSYAFNYNCILLSVVSQTVPCAICTKNHCVQRTKPTNLNFTQTHTHAKNITNILRVV